MSGLGGVLSRLTGTLLDSRKRLRAKYAAFVALLEKDRRCLALLSRLEDFQESGHETLLLRVERLLALAGGIVADLRALAPGASREAETALRMLTGALRLCLEVPAGPCQPLAVDLDSREAGPGLVGAKAARLAMAKARGYRVPPGFVFTAAAYHLFIEANELRPRLNALLAGTPLASRLGLVRACREMRRLIGSARIPDSLAAAMAGAASALASGAREPVSLAVRSSALFEDGQASFAGQYRTVLHVPPANLAAAYKAVLASKYSPAAVVYRNRLGLADAETAMAVLVMPMAGGEESGVAHSLDPQAGHRPLAAVYMSPGFGQGVVGGTTVPRSMYFTRESPPGFVGECMDGVCGFGDSPVTALAGRAREAASLAMQLEREFGRPQDVEWSLAPEGPPWLLQSRDLRGFSGHAHAEPQDRPGWPKALYTGGSPAVTGMASGQTFALRRESSLADLPDGCILVAKHLWPSLAIHTGKLNGVVAETGSRAGHFAIVAAESGVPVLAGAEGALAAIAPGIPVTLDVDARSVYPGLQGDPRRQRSGRGDTLDASARQRLLRVAALTGKLDPAWAESSGHGPAAIGSVHDLIRYCHEAAITGMFTMGYGPLRRIRRVSLPAGGQRMDLRLIRLDGQPRSGPGHADGLGREAAGPLLGALCQGLGHSLAARCAASPLADFDGLAGLSEGGIISLDAAAVASYAMVAKDHLHLQAKFGFHYAVLDCHLALPGDQNYVSFSFKGGGGREKGRLARLGLLSWALEQGGFTVSVLADMLRARLSRPTREEGLGALRLIGFALSRTRLLDMAADPMAAVKAAAADFRAVMEERT